MLPVLFIHLGMFFPLFLPCLTLLLLQVLAEVSLPEEPLEVACDGTCHT